MTLPDATEAQETAAPVSRRRQASLNDLLKKPRRTGEYTLYSKDDAGQELVLTLALTAISSRAYDDLVSLYPPTEKQKRDGAVFDVDRFAPAVIAAVVTEPRLSYDDAVQIYESDTWSGGEVTGLYLACMRLCNTGGDVPFTERG